MDLWTQKGKERVGQVGRVALKYIHCVCIECSGVSDSLPPRVL